MCIYYRHRTFNPPPSGGKCKDEGGARRPQENGKPGPGSGRGQICVPHSLRLVSNNAATSQELSKSLAPTSPAWEEAATHPNQACCARVPYARVCPAISLPNLHNELSEGASPTMIPTEVASPEDDSLPGSMSIILLRGRNLFR